MNRSKWLQILSRVFITLYTISGIFYIFYLLHVIGV